MGISTPFILRPIATSLLMLGVLVFGIAGYTMLPVAALPQVDYPTITVTAQLPGASPDTMASAVATPLEQQFTTIQGLTQMSSTSGLGSTQITLQFDLTRGIDGAAQDVQTAINAAGGLLPKNLPNPPTYRKVNPSDQAVLVYAVHSDSMPIYKVNDYATVNLADKLSSLPGVAQVDIGGQMQYALRVQMDPTALASRNIGLEEVRTALTNLSVNQPKGNVENAHQTVTLDTNDQLFDAASMNQAIIAYRNGAPVRVKDVGAAIDSVQGNHAGAWYDGTPAILLQIHRAPGANTVQVVNAVKQAMGQLRASIPDQVKIDLMADRSQTIQAAVHDVNLTLVLTIGLVVMVIFLFLRKFWATVIPAVAVPLSIIGTFGIMYMLGYSLDNLSLMGLSVAVGFVVDDAIVMIENIVRYIEAGERPLQAALKGAGQIGFTILSISVSLIAVFIPLLFMSGIIGRLFREFAVTVSVSVVVSALVSLTLTPVMCARFLKPEEPHGSGGRLNRLAEGFFDRLVKLYDRGLVWVLRHQLVTLLSTFALIAVSAFLYLSIPKGFFPQQDTGFLFAQADARQDTSFGAMSGVTQQLIATVRKDPAVAGVIGFTGATGGNPTESSARLFIALKPFAQRTATADQVIQRLRPQLATVQGVKTYLQAVQDINVGARLSRTQYQYTLTDPDSAELNSWAPKFLQAMTRLPGLQDVASDQQIASPHLAIQIDRDAMSRLGLTPQLIDDTLNDAFGARQISTIFTSSNQYKIILEVQPQFSQDASALDSLYVVSPSGAHVPLSAVAHFTPRVAPLTINHQGLFPAVTLSFNLAPGTSLGAAVAAIDQMRASLGAPASLQGAFQGTAQAFQSSLASTPILIAAAIFVVYIVLGMLYESYIHPITILSALPAAGVGALLMLMASGTPLDVMGIVGVILLIGIVKKNAIMMIDFALEAERHQGKSPREAIHEACLLRFRPIMMTTMTALFAGLPLALGHGAGSELRRPLGIAIVGGLLVSQLLTLYTTPVIYLHLDRLIAWAQRTRRGPRAAPEMQPAE